MPNNEVKSNYANILNSILIGNNSLTTTELINLENALMTNEKVKLENILNQVLKCVSFYYKKENFYHGFILGLFSTFLYNDIYIIKSNREACSDRFDLMIERTDRKVRVILELKISNSKNVEEVANNALTQMNNKEYYQELVLGKVKTIYTYAVVFYDKSCIVR